MANMGGPKAHRSGPKAHQTSPEGLEFEGRVAPSNSSFFKRGCNEKRVGTTPPLIRPPKPPLKTQSKKDYIFYIFPKFPLFDI